MDLLVSGLPRSGLTTVAALIDYLPNALCLNAPLWQTEYARQTGSRPNQFCKWLLGDFASTRAKILNGAPIADNRAADGIPLFDSIHDPRIVEEPVFFTRARLTPNFTLGMKHHALYTSLLPELVSFNHFKIIAVIRHPLDVIGSWQRLDKHAIAQGRLPAAARFWPEAERISSSNLSVLERMVQLYEAHIERYHQLREHIHIVKFEDVLENPAIISGLLQTDALPATASALIQRPRIVVRDFADDVGALFQQYGVFTKQYYQKI